MDTNLRSFLRNFSVIKARAQKGETVRILDKEGAFLFSCATPRRNLIGAAKTAAHQVPELFPAGHRFF